MNIVRSMVAAAAGFAITTAAVYAIVPGSLIAPAEAAAPASCLNPEYGNLLSVEDVYATQSDDSRGTRSNVWIVDGAQCQRISSIYIQPPAGGGYEFGYLVGYSSCAGYTGKFYSEPVLFFTSFTSNGQKQCAVWQHRDVVPGQYDYLRASDVDGNTYWGGYFNGFEMQPNGVNLDFAKGFNYAGAEQGDANDNGFARFNDLDEYHDGNGWSNWDDFQVDSFASSNPGWRWNRLTDNSASIIRR